MKKFPFQKAKKESDEPTGKKKAPAGKKPYPGMKKGGCVKKMVKGGCV